MSQNARESLSALMDNEGDELELRRLLKSLDEAPGEAEAWRRYHLMRSLMRREPGVDVTTDLSVGIMERLRDEQPPERRSEPQSRHAIPLGRGAGIAAAVTLLVIGGAQFYGSGGLGAGDAELATAPADGSVTTRERDLADTSPRAAPVDLPFFRSPETGSGQGLVTVGAGREAPLFTVPNPLQSRRIDEEQARLLQSYLDRHADGAAQGSGDAWMPLLRTTGRETLGQH